MEDQAMAQRPPDRALSPAAVRGKPTGPRVQAQAVLLQSEQACIAASALARRRAEQKRFLANLGARDRDAGERYPACRYLPSLQAVFTLSSSSD
jgi:hypothetical protein